MEDLTFLEEKRYKKFIDKIKLYSVLFYPSHFSLQLIICLKNSSWILKISKVKILIKFMFSNYILKIIYIFFKKNLFWKCRLEKLHSFWRVDVLKVFEFWFKRIKIDVNMIFILHNSFYDVWLTSFVNDYLYYKN